MKGYNGMTSDWLNFVSLTNPIYVEKGTELNIWYSEDLRDYFDTDNTGKHCVDVFAKISDDF